jgi:cyanophycin synthetase
MINGILVEAGANTGLACTDGVYLAGERIRQGDSSGFLYHHQVLQDSRVTHAVLETARGAALHSGLAYDACDIAVCTNVSDDHLEEFGIDTLEDMAAVKLYILKRAKRGAVLNADDPYARSMREALGSIRLGICSLSENRAGLEDWREQGTDLLYGVVELVAGQANLVLYDGDTRFPVIAIDQIPATYRGTARHNVSNALQATLACYLMGVPIEKIRRALSHYSAGFDNAPGRLNLIRESPFTVFLDYAHNADGYRILAEFIRAQSCTGKKILLLGLPGRIRPSAASEVAAMIAGCCDLYVCRDAPDLQTFQPGKLPEYLRSELMRHGIPADAVAVMTDEEASMRYIMSRAMPGDLLILCVTSAFREKAYQIVTGHT